MRISLSMVILVVGAGLAAVAGLSGVLVAGRRARRREQAAGGRVGDASALLRGVRRGVASHRADLPLFVGDDLPEVHRSARLGAHTADVQALGSRA